MSSSLNGTGVTFNDGSTQSTAAATASGNLANLGTTGMGTRLINTTYTNTLGRPMVWFFSCVNDNGTWPVWIDGLKVGTINGYGTSAGITIIVPAGKTYKLERGGVNNSTTWYEY